MNKTWEFWTVNKDEIEQIAKSIGFKITDEEIERKRWPYKS